MQKLYRRRSRMLKDHALPFAALKYLQYHPRHLFAALTNVKKWNSNYSKESAQYRGRSCLFDGISSTVPYSNRVNPADGMCIGA